MSSRKALCFSFIFGANMIIDSLDIGGMYCFQHCKAVHHFTNKTSFLTSTHSCMQFRSDAHTRAHSRTHCVSPEPNILHLFPSALNLGDRHLVLYTSSCKNKKSNKEEMPPLSTNKGSKNYWKILVLGDNIRNISLFFPN